MDMKQLQLGVLSAITSGVVALATLTVPSALAITPANGSGGTSCKGASGFAAQLFYFSNLYVKNTNANSQYISCLFPYTADADANALNIGLANPTGADVTFTCVVQSGTDGYGTINSASSSVLVPASTTFGNIYMNSSTTTPAIPLRAGSFASYTFSCLVPSQGKVTMVNIWAP